MAPNPYEPPVIHEPEIVFSPRADRIGTQATQAVVLAIVGFFCCGIILAPIALGKASSAHADVIRFDEGHEHVSKLKAAKLLAITVICLWVLGIVVRVAGLT